MAGEFLAAAVTSEWKPAYPQLAGNAHIQGVVILEARDR
jgi:hypothetical protein